MSKLSGTIRSADWKNEKHAPSIDIREEGGALAVTGVFEVAKQSDAPIARGQQVYFNTSTRTASAVVHGQAQRLGLAVDAAAQDAPTVRVRIDGTTALVVENS